MLCRKVPSVKKLMNIPPPHRFNPIKAGKTAVALLQLKDDGAWTEVELVANFGFTSAELQKRREGYRIISWRDAENRFFYPKWQFNETGQLIPGVENILRLFRSHDEWRVMSYFLGSRKQLDVSSPLDLIRKGKLKRVIDHAKLHLAENTW